MVKQEPSSLWESGSAITVHPLPPCSTTTCAVMSASTTWLTLGPAEAGPQPAWTQHLDSSFPHHGGHCHRNRSPDSDSHQHRHAEGSAPTPEAPQTLYPEGGSLGPKQCSHRAPQVNSAADRLWLTASLGGYAKKWGVHQEAVWMMVNFTKGPQWASCEPVQWGVLQPLLNLLTDWDIKTVLIILDVISLRGRGAVWERKPVSSDRTQ